MVGTKISQLCPEPNLRASQGIIKPISGINQARVKAFRAGSRQICL
jgi:hypothetical protein